MSVQTAAERAPKKWRSHDDINVGDLVWVAAVIDEENALSFLETSVEGKIVAKVKLPDGAYVYTVATKSLGMLQTIPFGMSPR